jgi:RNA polymerase sigma-70 factor (ECF subfamily)
MEPDPGIATRGVARQRSVWASSLEATRQSLLTRLRRPEDQEAWQRFFDTYAAVIHSLALRSGLSESESDDALQETLLSVSREMPQFRYDPSRGSFKGWLFQITRRRIADQFRRRVRNQRDGHDANDLIDEIPDANADALSRHWEEEWRENQLHLAVERVKRKVAARQWQMFDLVALQHWPTERVCSLLGVNRAQLYMARMRVGRLLKTEIQSLSDDAPINS